MDHRIPLRLGLAVLVAASLAGCGRKGPLELPPGVPQTQAAVPDSAVKASTQPSQYDPGLIQPPNKTLQRPVGEKLDQAAQKPSRPINAPTPPSGKPFVLDPLL